jgi:cell division GTPase FtsZ
MIVSIVSNENVALSDVTEAINKIRKEAAPNVKLIWGLRFDASVGDTIEITVIATKSGGLREQPISRPESNIGFSESRDDYFDTFDLQSDSFEAQSEASLSVQSEDSGNDTDISEEIEAPTEQKTSSSFDSLFSDIDFKFIQNIATKRTDR